MRRFVLVPYPYPTWPNGVYSAGRAWHISSTQMMLELDILTDIAFDELEAIPDVLVLDHVATSEKRVKSDKKAAMAAAGITINSGDVVGDALEDFFTARGLKFRA